MAEDQEQGSPKDKGAGKKAGGGSTAPELLKSAMGTAVPLIVSAVVSVGFVAFAGKAVLWTRFTALQVPAEQVVKAVPQGEAVATGASILLIFGFFGALATVALYLVDRGGRATLGMSRALLAVVVLEGGAAIFLTHQLSRRSILVAALVLFAIAAAAVGLTFVPWLRKLKDTLPPRPSETFGPETGPGPGGGELSPADSVWRLLLLVLPLIVALGFVAVLVLVEVPTWVVLGGSAAVVWFATAAAVVAWQGGVLKQIEEETEAERRHQLKGEKRLRKKEEEAGESRREGSDEKEKEKREEREAERERLRSGKHRPHRFAFNFEGMVVLVVLAVAAVAFPALILKQWWFAVSVGIAIALSFGLWRIACLAKPRFIWFGLAAFLSVPLFGALTLMVRNVGYPEAQPMAMIRKTDGPDESIQGLYVTETSDRIYFANVAIEGCENKLKRHSGRLLWVPSKEVVAMSVGPLQSVEEASRSAQEMAVELTPAVETPRAGAVSLTVAEKQSEKLKEAKEKSEIKEVEEGTAGRDQRLQNPGPAVRPNFGSGLQLVPEIASPGEEVELQARIPNANVHGFGNRPEGRLLRLNGVPVTVEREKTPRAGNAEYVKTGHNQFLRLDKEGLYGEGEGSEEPVPIDESEYEKDPRFVKLEDPRVEEVENGANELTSTYAKFLKVTGTEGEATLSEKKGEGPRVKLAGENHLDSLQTELFRQAWSEDRISFEVPRHAKSGVITIDCGQLASSPLLRVASPPVARIEARMRGGSKWVVLDGRRSRDANGQRLTDRWKIGKRSLGRHKRVALKLPPRRRPYRVRLTVTDPEGVSGSAELLLLRLPEPFFEFGKATLPKKKKHKLIERLEGARANLESFVNHHLLSSIELDGNADDVGGAPFNVTLSLHRARRVRKTLLGQHAHASAAAPAGTIPVLLRAFGETCPIVRAPGRQPPNRRVDVFVLEQGDRVVEPKGCKVGEEKRSRW
jgi:outer membrane protein OmpA-like peptidoglycan-associated protein